VKSYQKPIGKANVFQPPFFRGQLFNFGGVFQALGAPIGEIMKAMEAAGETNLGHQDRDGCLCFQ